MVERAFTVSPDEIPEKEVWFAMGYRDAVPEQRVCDLAREMVQTLVPKATLRYMYQVVEAEKLSPREVRMGGKLFTPEGIICSYLKGMTHALLYVATAGREFNEALKEIRSKDDIVQDFIADSIGSVLAEYALLQLEKDYPHEGGLSMPYSPGYCNWDIREQKILFSLFPPEPCGIRLSDSCLMYPEKSVSGFFALGETLVRQPYHCQICKNTRCYKRRNA